MATQPWPVGWFMDIYARLVKALTRVFNLNGMLITGRRLVLEHAPAQLRRGLHAVAEPCRCLRALLRPLRWRRDSAS